MEKEERLIKLDRKVQGLLFHLEVLAKRRPTEGRRMSFGQKLCGARRAIAALAKGGFYQTVAFRERQLGMLLARAEAAGYSLNGNQPG